MSGKALWPWMSPSSIYGRATKQFEFKLASNLQKGWNTWFGTGKMIVTIVRNSRGFHLVDAVPKGQKTNANYYIDRILQPLLESRSTGRGPGLMIHADNARPYPARKTFKFCRENRWEMARHPPYASDLAPSDFFLFGHVNHVLDGAGFPSEETLLAAIQRVLSNLTGDTLRAFFAKWVERLNWVALNETDYYR
jgi:transposase InsO family protein